ncbi:MAG: phosphomethylpyrimidine synthase ThiC, partial [Candidatus Diapherotrites archaeon]|nr:phosphomethylpyrimidine synthase ThiC [Candidatus Diapherotrites archaeon]
KGLTTKINANLGTSTSKYDLIEEKEKMLKCIQYGADAVMDLSTGGNLNEIRKSLLRECSVPFGTVPIYGAALKKNKINELTIDDLLDEIELQAKQGVDFMTIHAGLKKNMFPAIEKRTAGIVSRGGALLFKWMKVNNKENPLNEHFDLVLDLAKKYDFALSLGDGLRPGALADSTDKAQISELKELGKLTLRAWNENVQVMIEGPGHIPLNEIKKNVELQKKYCHNAPFYVLGPLVTDVAAGYDHVASAIGGAVAGMHGVDFLCYVTPAEHLGLPTIEEAIEGIIVHKIAAHAADLAKEIPSAHKRNLELSKLRANFEWNKQFDYFIEPIKARKIWERNGKSNDDFCSMCGAKFCAMRNYQEAKNK